MSAPFVIMWCLVFAAVGTLIGWELRGLIAERKDRSHDL